MLMTEQNLIWELGKETGIRCVTGIRNTSTTIKKFLGKMVTGNCTIGYTDRKNSWREVT